jgi:hypothetical protein
MRVDDLPESWTREPYQHEYPEHPVFDDPGTVRVIDIPDVVRYSDDPPPVDPPEPIGRLRPSWGDLHNEAVQRLRDAIGASQRQLRDAHEGCREFNYHPDVADQVDAALDRVMEALRLIDIHDPQ